MNKKILLIGYNFSPEPTGIGKYSGEMIYWLARNGYQCTVVTTYPYYPYWQVQEPYHQRRFSYITENQVFAGGGKMRVYRCPMYVPAKPSGLKRMLLDLSFLVSAFLKIIQLLPKQKFDFVIVIAPSFQFGLLGIIYKKLRKAKFIYHIQDLQIEAARDLQMIKSKSIINYLFMIEKYILEQADIISSISVEMIYKIKEKAKKDVLMFPNWVDTALFYPLADKAALKREFGFSSTTKIALYSGAIGEKQGLEAILYAAKESKSWDDIQFIICGSGPYKIKLQALAAELNIDNVVFFPLQPIEKFNKFLNLADVHLVIQKSTASDSVMPSKLTTILAVGGLCLITANVNSGLYTLVQQHNMGLLIESESQEALNTGIRTALASDRQAIKKNARAYAEAQLSTDSTMRLFEEQALSH